MSAGFEAFSSRLVLQSLQKKIEAVEVWESKVLVGLSDGTLMVLEQDKSRPESAYQVVKAVRGFGKKGVFQLQVWQDESFLISLDEDGVSLYKLPSFQIHCQANRSRYAQCFAWKSQSAMLAIAVKRKIYILHFNGNEFVELKDFSIAENVVCMSWLGEHICIGYKKEYALLNVETGTITDLFKSSSICMVKLHPAEELLVAKGNIGIVLGSSGRVSKRANIVWSDVPVEMAYSQPYAVAFFSSYIEIRSAHNLSSTPFAQVLSISNLTEAAKSITSNREIIVASGSEGGIQILQPLSLQKQAESLASMGELQEALRLASFIPDSQAEERSEVQDKLRILLGHQEFEQGEYGEAMAQFGMCSNANPVILLNLFPSLASKELLAPLQDTIQGYNVPDLKEPKEDDFERAVEIVLPYLMSYRGRLASQRQDQSDIEQDRDPTNQDTEIEMLENNEGELSQIEQTKGQSSILTDSQRKALECAIDTAILKAMLATKDSGALLRFAQGPNMVDLKEGERALKEKGRYAELVALYKSRGSHNAALSILKAVSLEQNLTVSPQGAAKEWGGVTGVWAAVRYLISLDSQESDLIKRNARWILSTDPEAGLDMFIQISHIVSPSLALSILTSHASQLVGPYLEACLENGSAIHKEFDHELANVYLKTALEKEGADSDGQSQTFLGEDEALQKLKNLIKASKFVEPQRLLLILPENQLNEIRALLLEKLGMYKKALRLYVHTMHSPALAEAYCDRLYFANVTSSSSNGIKQGGDFGSTNNYEIYLSLIQVYLEDEEEPGVDGSSPNSKNWGAVAQLLARKFSIIDPLVALNLVPDQAPEQILSHRTNEPI